ncbi:hypothetical protein J3U18_00145 [Gilliamella sp. B3482]|uniref:hypothetical protein n=1 Tax=Gilliamella sp. B3482 TaxID=2817991 RepID=UPI0022699187|nr:hypothetical protein [Gilliamella sp. B3482]MCX8580103.1 hypothetical protein [Gilliamella sp. B3482]
MSKKVEYWEDKIYDVDLPIPKFNQFDPVLYDGIRTEIADSANYYAFNDDGVMCPWYYVPTLLDNYIYIELVPETDLTKFTNN